MPIVFTKINPAESPTTINSEWFILRNDGDKTVSTRGCTIEVSRKGSKKSSSLGSMDPGFSLSPGESVRIITGNPGRKAHGPIPEDDIRNYNLFLAAPMLRGTGTPLTLRLRQLSLASAEFNNDAADGLAPSS